MSYWAMTFDGLARCVSDARRFTATVLGDVPGVDVVELVTSELAGNAIQHSGSGRPGGKFTLHLSVFEDRWHVRVDDAGGPTEPLIHRADASDAEAGRGLALVAALSRDWGVAGDHCARAVWAEIAIPQQEAT